MNGHFLLLDPKGTIARGEFDLIRTAVAIMLLIVIPALIALFSVAWRYRAGNNAKYDPDAAHGRLGEIMIWVLPCLIVAALGVIGWKTAHDLDPYRPIASTDAKPITVQVVALSWKWLFIYPEQGIATVNFLEFPAGTPLNLELTADAPMNSFWIPQLGGQMYAMPGMTTQLHLMADAPGEFQGSAAEVSGPGFAGMRFVAKATSRDDFAAWVASIKQMPQMLTLDAYRTLAEPSEDAPQAFYSSVESGLYATVIAKFMTPLSTSTPVSSSMPPASAVMPQSSSRTGSGSSAQTPARDQTGEMMPVPM